MIARVAAVVVGAVFLVAGATKIASVAAWRQQAADLGAPQWIARVLPGVEIAIGALLVSQFQRRAVAIAAAAVLLAFTALLVVRLRQGRRPPCACFGSLSAKPIGWSHVARNAVFVAVAAVAVFA